MPYVLKPALEQFRSELSREGKMMLEKDIVPVQAALEGRLSRIPDLLVEKVRRFPRPDGMLEISCKWFGFGDDQRDVVRILKEEWPEDALGAFQSRFTVAPSEEAVLLTFAAAYESGRFLTGRMLITF